MTDGGATRTVCFRCSSESLLTGQRGKPASRPGWEQEVAPAGGFGDILSGGEGRQLRSLDISLASSQRPAVAPTSSSPCLLVAHASQPPHPVLLAPCVSAMQCSDLPQDLCTCCSLCPNVSLCPVSPPGWPRMSLLTPEMPSTQSRLPDHLVAASPWSAVFSSHSCLLSSSPTTLEVVLPAGSVLLRAWHGRGPGNDRGKRQVQRSCPLVPERCQNQYSGAQRARLC